MKTFENKNTFENKIAVVTGGNSGIGLATAQALAARGASVAIFGRTQETLDAAEKSIDGPCVAVQGDVRRLEDLDKLFAVVKETYGRIDVLVANAGWGQVSPFLETDEAGFDVAVETNLKGTFFTIQKAVPLMAKGGSVVIVSSVAGNKGLGGMSAYSASKAAVRSLARTLTAELSPQSIRVNVLSPGVVDTPAFGRMPGLEREMLAGFQSLVPLGRVGTPQDMAKAACFLASDESGYVAGAELCADGGWTQV